MESKQQQQQQQKEMLHSQLLLMLMMWLLLILCVCAFGFLLPVRLPCNYKWCLLGDWQWMSIDPENSKFIHRNTLTAISLLVSFLSTLEVSVRIYKQCLWVWTTTTTQQLYINMTLTSWDYTCNIQYTNEKWVSIIVGISKDQIRPKYCYNVRDNDSRETEEKRYTHIQKAHSNMAKWNVKINESTKST